MRIQPIKNMSKRKNQGSKNNLEKHEDDIAGLPKISNPSTNFSNMMVDNYKRTFYSKKNSTNFNFTIFHQGKKKQWRPRVILVNTQH